MRILITAGPVYGKLDDNKIVSNRSRGIWALKFAVFLHEETKHDVTVLVPDIVEKDAGRMLGHHLGHDGLTLLTHSGFSDYADICKTMAPNVDAAIMAAAVLNWIPEKPFPGKMPTDSVGTNRQMIPFILAPRVISMMKTENPTICLIGCKLLFSMDYDKLIDAAYHVVLESRCNAVVANDARIGLKVKYVVHQDRSVATFEGDFGALYEYLLDIIEDEHYRTEIDRDVLMHPTHPDLPKAKEFFDRICDANREAFKSRGELLCKCPDYWFPENRREQLRRMPHGGGLAHHESCPKATGESFVFGSVAVRVGDYFLVSPREKGSMFSSKDAVLVKGVKDRVVHTLGGKATLNAPLLVRHLLRFPQIQGVVHLHTFKDDFSTKPYAPPGTARDNERPIPGYVYNIEGHGVVGAVGTQGRILKKQIPPHDCLTPEQVKAGARCLWCDPRTADEG